MHDEDEWWFEHEPGKSECWQSAAPIIDKYTALRQCWRLSDSPKGFERYVFRDYRGLYNLMYTYPDKWMVNWIFAIGLSADRFQKHLAHEEPTLKNPLKQLYEWEQQHQSIVFR